MIIERSVPQYCVFLSSPFLGVGVSSVYGYQLEVSRTVIGPVRVTQFEDMQGFDFSAEAVFNCFIPLEQEVHIGTVYHVGPIGCMIEVGPAKQIYLYDDDMGLFEYVEQNGVERYENADHRIIEVGTILRFRILTSRYEEVESDFIVECTIDEDGLGLIDAV